MVQHMKNDNIPAYISYSAGTYVCNDVFYHLMYLIHTEYPKVRGGFIHVLFELSQVVNMSHVTPSMPIQTITKGLQLAIEAAILNSTDLQVKGGATH